MPRPRVFLADDHLVLLDALARLLQDTCDVVGTASNGQELLEQAPAARPDVVILDVSMPQLNGLDAAVRLRDLLPDARFVFLTMNRDADLAARALAEGASGFVLKSSASSEIRMAIEAALTGGTYVTPALAGEVLGRSRQPASGVAALTPRQRDVLRLLAEGLAMKQVAAELGITARTVAHHKYTIMENLGIKTTSELVRFAVRSGLVSE